jgi:aryl-alcohol dehydrogenase-like predicted oxidoreductase
VHNLVDTAAHLRTLRAERDRGRVRHIGITHYTASAHAELCRWMRAETLDFVQVNYSLMEPEAANSVLPLAAERGVGVLINRPFAEGALFAATRGRELPAWVREELGCRSWAQSFLKWILAESAVTTVLCGTRNPRHVADNLGAMPGPLPTPRQRARLRAEVLA